MVGADSAAEEWKEVAKASEIEMNIEILINDNRQATFQRVPERFLILQISGAWVKKWNQIPRKNALLSEQREESIVQTNAIQWQKSQLL